ncbi:MAG: hypothetical protein JEZ02_21045, partial [Desulfatibacillum sp.]|nr:hypothetical protein [Desulfatibacillum sp.]
MGKYNVKDDAFDPVHEVLKNKLAIMDPEELQSKERDCLLIAYSKAALNYSEDHVFTEEDIRALHNLFLGDLYEWAGTYRTVDLSSENIRYCHAAYI